MPTQGAIKNINGSKDAQAHTTERYHGMSKHSIGVSY